MGLCGLSCATKQLPSTVWSVFLPKAAKTDRRPGLSLLESAQCLRVVVEYHVRQFGGAGSGDFAIA